MNGKRAKALRKSIYGDDMSPRSRLYTKDRTGETSAGPLRHAYQALKRAWCAVDKKTGDDTGTVRIGFPWERW